MPPLIDSRREQFCLEYVQAQPAQQAAIKAGYAKSGAHVTAGRLLKNATVLARIQELKDQIASDKIMSIQERQERLSEIARGRLSDFVECGPDGSWVNIGVDGCQSAALQEVTSKTEYDDNGDHPTVITKIKLHNPMQAIAELNKMDGAYAPERKDVRVAQVTQVIVGENKGDKPFKEIV